MLIKTDRLILRDFINGDYLSIYKYQKDPQYLRYYHWEKRTLKDVRLFIQDFINQQNEKPRTKFQVAIVLASTKELIGNCGIRKKNPNSSEATIGYEINPKYWRMGYATEAANAILQFGFNQLKLHRISSHCISDNVASKKVLEKIGMLYEGKLCENIWLKKKWRDTLLYGILKHQYPKY